ncbi:MAG: hypothetical protein WC515_05030 [Candidatus Omnitrophota bacterium]
MNKIYIPLIAAALIFIASYAYCEESGPPDSDYGRYRLQEIKVGNEMVPFLIDTATGKIWMYQSDISTKKRFVGMSVEGIAYSGDEKDQERLNKQIEQWHFNNFIDKATKGVREKIFSDFSYDPDVEKAERIYYKLKNKK